jgi:hypothetical protein
LVATGHHPSCQCDTTQRIPNRHVCNLFFS